MVPENEFPNLEKFESMDLRFFDVVSTKQNSDDFRPQANLPHEKAAPNSRGSNRSVSRSNRKR
jgi:hypothetical protein